MEVRRATDDYELLAVAFDRPAGELRAADAQRGDVPARWLALTPAGVAGAVTVGSRPDERSFLRFGCPDPGAYRPLVAAVAAEITGKLCTTVDAADRDTLGHLAASGFAIESTHDAFRVSFDRALAALSRAAVPSGFTIVSAADADVDRLFALDNAIRNDVPGSDGWRGNRAWFVEELAESPPFDPAAYLVAVDDETGAYAGLVRVWRNPDGPRFGLIGVEREYRTTRVAAALIRRALEAAAEWGSTSFVTETSLSNRVVHPRLVRLAEERLGRWHQLILRR